MRTLPIHLDRLQAALASKGVTLKRHNLLEIAAAAFGYHGQNQLAAAAKAGDLDPSPARMLGSFEVSGRKMVMLEDDEKRPFVVDHATIGSDKANAFVTTPYGQIADIRNIGEVKPLAMTNERLVHRAAITHDHGSNMYQDSTKEGLDRQIADWCREYWQQEGIPGDYDDLDDETVISEYFEYSQDEGVTYFDPEGSPAVPYAPREAPYVPKGFDMRSPYVIGRLTGDADEPMLYWSNTQGWGDAIDATSLSQPTTSWPLDAEPGSLFVMPIPEAIHERGSRHSQPVDPDIEFLTNRDCDIQGAEEYAQQALPWVEADEIDVGLGPVRMAEIGYSALVDGSVFLAPTIKAFHFDSAEPVRAMIENRTELQDYAEEIEPVIKSVGGMITLEEDIEAVTLTIYVPLDEARKAENLEAWKEALQDLLTIGGRGPRVIATFNPQTMIAGGCYDADPHGDVDFDVTYEIKLMGTAGEDMEDSDDTAESLADAIRAPEWIRQWSGPFSIQVAEAVAAWIETTR